MQKTVHFFSELIATDPELVELVSPLVPDCPPELRREIAAGIKRAIRESRQNARSTAAFAPGATRGGKGG